MRVETAARRNAAAVECAAAAAAAAAVVNQTIEEAITEEAAYAVAVATAADATADATAAAAFAALNLSAASAAASDDFETFASNIQSPDVLRAADAFFARVARLARLAAGSAEDHISATLLRCLFPKASSPACLSNKSPYPIRVVGRRRCIQVT
jgi:hypothetical protein